MGGSPIAHVLHAAQLRDLADGKSFARGKSYHQQGRVSGLSRDGKTVTATVSGSHPYRVKLWATGDRIAFSCTCPMGEEGSFCKHCVAVSLTLLEQLSKVDQFARTQNVSPSGAPLSTTLGSDVSGHHIADEETAASAVSSSSSVGVVSPPTALPDEARPSVFLAGSIDMGDAPRWQDDVIAMVADVEDLLVFNPRRADWDPDWEQSLDNPEFCAQVEWELDAMAAADVIAMYFAPNSKAPVTLLELGLAASSGKLIVCCPEGFWRKGNVDVVCRRFAVHQTHDLPTLVRAVRARITSSRRS